MNGQSILPLLLRPYINVDKLCKKYNNVKTNRSAWDSKWQMIQDQVFPDYRDYMNNTVSSMSPKTSKIKNHSSVISGKINKIVSILNAQMCDPSVKWLDLKFGDEQLNHYYPVAAWLWECTEILYRLFADPETEFYTSTFSFHFDWFSIGSACREVSLRKDNGKIKFSTVSMQDIYIETSGYGDIDTIYRKLNLTAQQAISLWGGNVHPSIIENAQKEDETPTKQKHEFFEVVMPNPIRDKIPSLAWLSCVIDKTNKHICDMGLHAVPPYVVSRFFVAPGETYGRSYVWTSMPDIIALNQLSKRILQGVDFATMPIVLVQDATALPQQQITPGAFIQGLDQQGRPQFQQMQFGGNTPLAIEFYQAKLQDLEDALVARDIFGAENANMTATEVNERKIQASNRLRPLLVRLETEDLNRTVLRTLKLLEQLGQLPLFPYEEMGIDPIEMPDPIMALRVTFSGQMAKMQKMQDVVNSDLIFNKAVQAAQVDPSVLDRVNLDQLIVHDAEIFGVPKNVMNSDEVVQKIREEREKQRMRQQQMEVETAFVQNLAKLKESGAYDQIAE